MRLFRNNRGDTIVEVMIAMAVTTAVLGAAYGAVNRATASIGLAQERSQALGIATAQVDSIKAIAGGDNAAPLYANASYRCINDTGAIVTQTSVRAVDVPGTSDSRYDSNCKGIGAIGYRVAFNYTAAPDGAPGVFKVTVAWPGRTGNNDNVTLTYKAYRK